jgi:hypothetical protein
MEFVKKKEWCTPKLGKVELKAAWWETYKDLGMRIMMISLRDVCKNAGVELIY